MKQWLGLFACAALPVWAASSTKPAVTVVEFRVDIQKTLPNDLGSATAFIETDGADPAEVAGKVKTAMAEGLALAKSQPGITVKTGNTHTWPIYAKNGRLIDNWRMRSEILLESRDAVALSIAVGALQTKLAVGGLQFAPSPETRRKAENDAALEAIAAFRAQATRIAATLKKPFRIRQMSVNGSGRSVQSRPAARAAAAMMAADSAPMPVEAGDSSLTVSVSGKIELPD